MDDISHHEKRLLAALRSVDDAEATKLVAAWVNEIDKRIGKIELTEDKVEAAAKRCGDRSAESWAASQWPADDFGGIIHLDNVGDPGTWCGEYLTLSIVEMYDPLGHFVYFESHGGFSYESGRKRNTTQATSSRARS